MHDENLKLELKLDGGENWQPASVDPWAAAEVMFHWLALLRKVAEALEVELDLVGLEVVKSSFLQRHRFRTEEASLNAVPVVQAAAQAVAGLDPSPPESATALGKALAKIPDVKAHVVHRGVVTELTFGRSPRPRLFWTSTSLRCRVLRTGVEGTPRVRVEDVLTGERLTLSSEREMACRLGACLDTEVELQVLLQTDGQRTVAGRIEDMRELDQGDSIELMRAWIAANGGQWADEPDVDVALRRIRSQEVSEGDSARHVGLHPVGRG